MSIKHVSYVSRREAEKKLGTADWALISITDPFHYPAALKSGWQSVLRLEFSDIEQASKPLVLFSEKDACAVIEFVRQSELDGCVGVLVHCKAGISRSAAIAKWIAAEYKLQCDTTFDGYNRHVYSTMLDVANNLKGGCVLDPHESSEASH